MSSATGLELTQAYMLLLSTYLPIQPSESRLSLLGSQIRVLNIFDGLVVMISACQDASQQAREVSHLAAL